MCSVNAGIETLWLLHKFKDKTYNYISKKIKHASHTILNTYDPFLFELNTDFMQAKKKYKSDKINIQQWSDMLEQHRICINRHVAFKCYQHQA
jgi:hypothetical protein